MSWRWSSERERGVVIVELALAMPIVLFGCLGFLEAGFAIATKADQDRATSVVAQWAATHHGSSWESIAHHELPHCTVDVADSEEPLDLVVASSSCPYEPVVAPGLWPDLAIASSESAVVPNGTPDASPSPEPSPTVEP